MPYTTGLKLLKILFGLTSTDCNSGKVLKIAQITACGSILSYFFKLFLIKQVCQVVPLQISLLSKRSPVTVTIKQ